MRRFDGRKNPARRQLLEDGEPLTESLPRQIFVVDVAEYRKTATIYAVRMDETFEVDTLEGRHTGKVGDFLAVGAAGELYPIDAAIFASTYEKVDG